MLSESSKIPKTKGKLTRRLSVPKSINEGANIELNCNVVLKSQWSKHNKEVLEDPEYIPKSIVQHMASTLAYTPDKLSSFNLYQSCALSVRDRLLTHWNLSNLNREARNVKSINYISMEFLIGRSFDNALLNMNIRNQYEKTINSFGLKLEDLLDEERDAALGNGGLGRLAACYMDSLATLELPAYGYGLRYRYGIFKQLIRDGFQEEVPDFWLNFENPWEIPRNDIQFSVRFFGSVKLEHGRYYWEGGEVVEAMAYDVPVPGYGTKNCATLRLWSSKPHKKFDLCSFNKGDYESSVKAQNNMENITSVLYPNDNHIDGKELRLKQEYFLVASTLMDIVMRFKKHNKDWSLFSTKMAVQLNDTHPTLAIPELQRILVDIEGLHWDQAWKIVTETFAFTNHTILPEAMEKWSVPMMQHVLPRHMQLIFQINLYFLQSVEAQFPNDKKLIKTISIIEEGDTQYIKMAHLACIGSHHVNGVAELHSKLIKKNIFHDFVTVCGDEKFVNITNGISPRRWLNQCNPLLSELITAKLNSNHWQSNLKQLKGLEKHLKCDIFLEEWMTIKHQNKVRLADYIKETMGVVLDPTFLFDVQVKRIHEYKRQFMNILGVLHRYLHLKDKSKHDRKKQLKRAVIFAGKAAPAKTVIKLINDVAELVNNDPEVSPYLKVLFLPDYNVSLAELIIPASDISQHISTAGTEASGTSNMKFVLNGGLILGTIDGANIEIAKEIGEENIFLFGLLADEVEEQRLLNSIREADPILREVINFIKNGKVNPNPDIYHELLDTISHHRDYYLLNMDFKSYLDAQDKVDIAYSHTKKWAQMSVKCTANMGKFSADRSALEYSDKIWNLDPCPFSS